eukprot:3881630-Alexandrium_andersonii.AAC.1
MTSPCTRRLPRCSHASAVSLERLAASPSSSKPCPRSAPFAWQRDVCGGGKLPGLAGQAQTRAMG